MKSLCFLFAALLITSLTTRMMEGQTPSEHPVVSLDPAIISLVHPDAKLHAVKYGSGDAEAANEALRREAGYSFPSDAPGIPQNKSMFDEALSASLGSTVLSGAWNGHGMQTVDRTAAPATGFVSMSDDSHAPDLQGKFTFRAHGDGYFVQPKKIETSTVLANSDADKSFSSPIALAPTAKGSPNG